MPHGSPSTGATASVGRFITRRTLGSVVEHGSAFVPTTGPTDGAAFARRQSVGSVRVTTDALEVRASLLSAFLPRLGSHELLYFLLLLVTVCMCIALLLELVNSSQLERDKESISSFTSIYRKACSTSE